MGRDQDLPETHLPFDLATLDLLPYGVIVVDAAGVVLYYNKREEQIAGRRQGEVIGRNFFTEVAPCTNVKEFFGRFEAVLVSDHAAVFDFVFPFTPTPRHVSITLNGFEHQGRRLCLISVNDKTAQEEIRARIERAERYRELGEVATRVAHNFNNLLTIIRGNIDLLAERDDLTADEREVCELITKAAGDGAQLVARIRQVSTREPAVAAPTLAVGPVIDDAVAWLGALSGREATPIRVLPRAQEWTVAMAPFELREVLVNLLRNALDATADRAAPSITVVARSTADGVAIDVRDNGTGMSDETRRRLFQPFFSTKGEQGTGLGLATAFAMLHRRGGSLEVYSVEDVGTTFTIHLPRVASPTS